MILKCKRCKTVWDYKGKNKYYATCPHCLNKVRVIQSDKTLKKVQKESAVESVPLFRGQAPNNAEVQFRERKPAS